MRRLLLILAVAVLLGCTHPGVRSTNNEAAEREYSATAITLSDFSMKIMGQYRAKGESIPSDFDTKKFFEALKSYPDQTRVEHVQKNYNVSVRPVEGGYSVMLCDLKTNRKVMEDLSCHLNRVEIRTWQTDPFAPCAFENEWVRFCKE